MENRREFLRKGILVFAGSVAGRPARVFASPGVFPKGLVYTREDPGKWAKKVGSHAPKIDADGLRVTITTEHPMTQEHYIVRHTLVTADGDVLGGRTFYPSDGKAVSVYVLDSPHNPKLYATSFCNLHDFWLTEFTA